MTDILLKIRADNLRRLGDELGRDVIAAKCGYKDTKHVHNLCAGNVRSFGNSVARKIETALDLPALWLDQDRSKAVERDEMAEFIDDVKSLREDDFKSVKALVRSLVLKHNSA